MKLFILLSLSTVFLSGCAVTSKHLKRQVAGSENTMTIGESHGVREVYSLRMTSKDQQSFGLRTSICKWGSFHGVGSALWCVRSKSLEDLRVTLPSGASVVKVGFAKEDIENARYDLLAKHTDLSELRLRKAVKFENGTFLRVNIFKSSAWVSTDNNSLEVDMVGGLSLRHKTSDETENKKIKVEVIAAEKIEAAG